MFEKIKRIHFIGIGGSGMSGIAEVLINMGYDISGSDIALTPNVRHLRKIGAKIYIGHKKKNLNNPHVVVTSSAIAKNNCEVIQAVKNFIPVIPRAEMLAELMRLKYSLCIAGTHGKTTTTSMIGLILSEAKLDPTIVVGGRLKNLPNSAQLGKGQFIVAESDESDGSFLNYSPSIGIVTNIDDDHLDYYKSMKNLKETFIKFLNKMPFYGFSILCGDDKNIKDILDKLNRPYKTYGLNPANDYTACNIRMSPHQCVYEVKKNGKIFGEIKINNPGMYNVLNSLAASATAIEMGIDFKKIKVALNHYKGVKRRLEKVAARGGVIFYDDYAHHPTEIALSLKSLKEIYPEKRIIVIFQPHRFTRTKKLYKKFPQGFKLADFVFITDIYSASEKPIRGISASMIAGEFKNKKKVKYIKKITTLTDEVRKTLQSGDICIAFGAGDINKIIKNL